MAFDSVIFKVFFKTDDSFETRKFVVDDASVITSFLYIKGKLAMIFPKLNNVPFKITWKDMDGDDITIDNDEDLVMAFTEMTGPVKVLYVSTSQPHQETQCKMFNVCCDVCNKVITGFRYKCLQCPDFDLCSDCEHAENHKEHYMLRSANGELPFSGMCKKISENINKSIKKAQSMAYKEAHRNAKYSKRCEKKYDHSSKFKCGTEIPNLYEIPNSVMELINSVVMSYAENQKEEPTKSEPSQQSQSNTGDQQSNEHQQQAQQPQQSQQQQPQQQQQQPPIVEMIMKAVNNIFPELVTPRASTSADNTPPTQNPTGGVTEQPQQSPNESVSSSEYAHAMEEDGTMKDPIPKSQAWTLINHDCVENIPREGNFPNPQIPATPITPHIPLYPQIPILPKVQQIPIPQATTPVSPQDQKILDGMKKLKDMGFNEHPDLLALLRRYDGQVGLVIKHIFDNNDGN